MKPEPVKQQSSIKTVNYNIVVLLIKFAALAAVGLLKKNKPPTNQKNPKENRNTLTTNQKQLQQDLSYSVCNRMKHIATDTLLCLELNLCMF